jgi:NhaA family Na+:H+ antiporter
MKLKLANKIKLPSLGVPTIVRVFLRDESIGGKLILLAAVLALVVANSPLAAAYESFWHTQFTIGLGNFSLSLDLRHWVNEALMALFFLVVGLEIKREIVHGELRKLKTAALPVGAAIGGMIFPALIYLAFNPSGEVAQGWGIPIATDIAFAVAVLALLGKRVPLALKLFLLTLAIADDVGAIIVVALFYAEIIHVGFLLASVGLVVALFAFNKRFASHILLFVAAGVVLWVTTHLSGIHASIVGAVLGLAAPLTLRGNRPGMAERLEKAVLPSSTFFILPLFAFANAGVVLSGNPLQGHTSVVLGIVFGLVAGKALGIVLASWLLVRFGVASLPQGVSWRHILGVGFIAGIGFTVSIFITELAFPASPALVDAAKLSIFIASALSAVIGSVVLLRASRHRA